jgi:hypothetical protein
MDHVYLWCFPSVYAMKMLFSGDDEQFQPKIFVYRSLKKIMPSNHIDEEEHFL